MQNLSPLSFWIDEKKIEYAALDLKEHHLLLRTDHPIAFSAPLNPEIVALIYFLHAHQKSFFPLNPELPVQSQLEIAEETRSHLYDVSKKEFIYTCRETPFVRSPSLLLQTSGSSSKPKTAVLSFENIDFSALGSVNYFSLEANHIWNLSLPLFHVGGIMPLFRILKVQGSLSILTKKSVLPHPKATHSSFVPTQLYRALTQNCSFSPHLEVLLVGGAAIDSPLIEECKKRSIPLYLTYGMTETTSQVTCGLYEIGHPLPYREINIDESGEIGIKGKTLFEGYLSDEGTLNLPLNSEGFFMTRDLGLYSAEKGLMICGRKDRQFISGGENIQPEEVEKVLKGLYGFSYCKVVPEPSQEFGMVGVVYVDPMPTVSFDQIKAELKAHLPSYKIPKKMIKGPQSLSLKDSL